MFCTQCGANNADGAMICAQCGRSLQVPAPPVPAQPGAMVQAVSPSVPNYLVFAILATVLCCLPTGIAAIVYAAQVNGKVAGGRHRRSTSRVEQCETVVLDLAGRGSCGRSDMDHPGGRRSSE
jgi:hypothetical protein